MHESASFSATDGTERQIKKEYLSVVNKRPDVLIVGGGVSGLAAAVGAARLGCRVLIIEKEMQLGGMLRKGLGIPICGLFGMGDDVPERTINDGLASDFYHHVCAAKRNNTLMRLGKMWVCQSSPKEAVGYFESQMEKIGHICSLKNTVLHSVEIEDGRIAEVQAFSGETLVSITPKVVVECSGDGAALACCPGATLPYDQMAGALAGVVIKIDQVQPDDTMLAIRVPYVLAKASLEGDVPRSLSFTTFQPLEKPGEGILKLSVLPDLSLSEQQTLFDRTLITVWNLLQREIPSLAQARIVETSSGLLQRVGLRGHGQYILTKGDVMNARKFEGKGVKCAWPIEYWDCEKGPQYYYLDAGQYFEIPLTCLISESINNLLLSGRCISATEGAISSVRVMGTCLSLGEAAGILAGKRIGIGEHS